MPDQTEGREQSWTYGKYLTLDDENRYELIGGALIQEPAPGTTHQRSVGKLFRRFDDYVTEHQLGEVFVAPVDVVLDEHNTVQPDLVFVARERGEIVRERGVFGPPDLVVEIISLGSLRRDRTRKMSLYREFGVREYWIVDPSYRSIEVYTLGPDGYAIGFVVEGEGEVESEVIAGLKVAVDQVFGGMADSSSR